MSSADRYRHMWDGSEPGWTLLKVERPSWTVEVPLESRSFVSLVRRLRAVIPELGELRASEALTLLRGQECYAIRELGEIEFRHMAEALRNADIGFDAHYREAGGTVLVSPTGTEVVIDDAEVLEEVKARMLEAGVPVAIVCVD